MLISKCLRGAPPHSRDFSHSFPLFGKTDSLRRLLGSIWTPPHTFQIHDSNQQAQQNYRKYSQQNPRSPDRKEALASIFAMSVIALGVYVAWNHTQYPPIMNRAARATTQVVSREVENNEQNTIHDTLQMIRRAETAPNRVVSRGVWDKEQSYCLDTMQMRYLGEILSMIPEHSIPIFVYERVDPRRKSSLLGWITDTNPLPPLLDRNGERVGYLRFLGTLDEQHSSEANECIRKGDFTYHPVLVPSHNGKFLPAIIVGTERNRRFLAEVLLVESVRRVVAGHGLSKEHPHFKVQVVTWANKDRPLEISLLGDEKGGPTKWIVCPTTNGRRFIFNNPPLAKSLACMAAEKAVAAYAQSESPVPC